MQPTEPLRQFLQAARSAGIRVSAAEGIDAARVVQVVGFSDRTVLKELTVAGAGKDAGREEPVR